MLSDGILDLIEAGVVTKMVNSPRSRSTSPPWRKGNSSVARACIASKGSPKGPMLWPGIAT